MNLTSWMSYCHVCIYSAYCASGWLPEEELLDSTTALGTEGKYLSLEHCMSQLAAVSQGTLALALPATVTLLPSNLDILLDANPIEHEYFQQTPLTEV